MRQLTVHASCEYKYRVRAEIEERTQVKNYHQAYPEYFAPSSRYLTIMAVQLYP